MRRADITRIIQEELQHIISVQDHEVGMAIGQLQAIHNAVLSLQSKIAKDGHGERNLPGWIQSHITSAYEYLKQANDNFHELIQNDLHLGKSSPYGSDYTKVSDNLKGKSAKR